MSSSEGGVKASPVETVESLTKEAEALKQKLEDERQKLNDVTCMSFPFACFQVLIFFPLFSGNCC